jgi:o-succinylbenzoate---CoA ligase
MKRPNIDWDSDNQVLLCNPRLSKLEKDKAQRLIQDNPCLKGHVWIATSGSHALAPGHLKWTALSKEALLSSASAVNSFLNCSSQDYWLNPLPFFHVGGLGIQVRSYLTGFKIIDLYAQTQGKWDASQFCQAAHQHQATLSSLVPAQVYDLVQQELAGPKSLRAILVGGSALHPKTLNQAIELGWPLYPSYGLTECASTVAIADSPSSPEMKLLSHVKVDITSTGLIRIKSPALLTLYALQTDQGFHYHDPKENDWFTTEDRGEIQDQILNILGRASHWIKIGGEKVDLLILERILEEIRLRRKLVCDMALVPMPDARLEYVIHLATTSNDEQLIDEITLEFNQRVMPYEKIRARHFLSQIPRTHLFKIKVKELYTLLKVDP